MIPCSSCGEALQAGVRFCPQCGAQSVPATEEGDALVGRVLRDKYRVVARIGEGSMGTVYEGEHLGLKKKVALKVLRPELELKGEVLQRFQREGIAAGRFSHPNAIQIFDFDQADERTFYLAMEYVEGSNLKELVHEEGPLDAEEAVEIVRQILGALAAAHAQGIVHRDLKPENVMVTRGADGEPSVKVLDFGLSKLVHVPLGASLATVPGRVMGTPMYMSPEQGLGEEVDHRADLYAVGLILFELLAGRTPFHAETLTELMTKQLTEPVPSLTESWPDLRVPGPLDDVVAHALEKQRDDRYASAEEMLADLESVDLARRDAPARRGRPARTARSTSRSRPTRPSSRGRSGRRERGGRPILTGVLSVVGLAAVLAVGWGMLRPTAAEADAALALVTLKAPDARSPEEQRYVVHLTDARTALRRGDLDEALAAAGAAHELPCRDAEAFYVRGEVYAAREDHDAALADFREALRAHEEYALAAAAAGWVELERGRLDAARERFDEAVVLDDACAAAVAGQGAALRRLGADEAARERLERALELDPEEARAARALGDLHAEAGELDAAVEAYVRAKRSAPRSAGTLLALGRAYLASGREDDAERELRAALAIEEDLEPAVTTLGALLVDERRHGEAIEILSEAVQRRRDWGRAHVLLGSALGEEGRLEEAADALERAVELQPGDPLVRLLLGVLLQEEGRLEEALEQYDEALAVNANLESARLSRGLCLFELERYEEAAAELELALELAPENAFGHYALGVLYMDYVPGGDAAEHLEEYRRLDGSDDRVGEWIERTKG